MRQTSMFGLAVTVVALGTAGCTSTGPYGYARTYAWVDGEREAVGAARELDPVMAERHPGSWKTTPVQLFAVVLSREPTVGGLTVLNVSLRKLEARNLCADESASSCRVTVTAKSFATLQVLVKLRSDDENGPRKVAPGSLLRVVGRLEEAGGDREPVVRASWYRHWPSDEYVTTAARSHMRR